jgi:hypothetical protein
MAAQFLQTSAAFYAVLGLACPAMRPGVWGALTVTQLLADLAYDLAKNQQKKSWVSVAVMNHQRHEGLDGCCGMKLALAFSPRFPPRHLSFFLPFRVFSFALSLSISLYLSL